MNTGFQRIALRSPFGLVVYQAGGKCGPRVQPQFQLVVVHEGEADIEVDDDEIHLPANHMTLLWPGREEMFRFSRTGVTRHSWFSIDPDTVPRDWYEPIYSAPRVLPATPEIEALVDTALEMEGTSEWANGARRSVALACIQAYLRFAEEGEIRLRRPDSVRRALRLIEQSYSENLDVDRLAREAGVSKTHLIRLFREHVGSTPSRFLWNRRVEQGARLLSETGLSVSEIAYQCGFQNPFHFSRAVRKRYRVSPREMRTSGWGK